MEAIHFDAKTGREIPSHEVRGATVGFISWVRLPELFKAGGETRPNERMLSFQVDERGITFWVTTI